jgi:uncharacterized protein (TIRG00374 family)
VCCFILLTFSCAAAFYRWNLLLIGQGLHFSFWNIIRYGMIGAFFNTTMPGAVSGDIIKAWYMVADHKQYDKTRVLTTILLDRVFGVFGLVIVSSVPLFWNWNKAWAIPELHHVALLIVALAGGVVFFFGYILLSMHGPLALLRNKMEVLAKNKYGAVLVKAYDALMEYRNRPRYLFLALFFSVCTHLFVMAMVIACAHAIGETKLELYQYFILVPIGLLTTAVPIAPAGLGVGHVAFGALFGLLGSENGAEIFTLFVAIQISFNLLGSFFYISGSKRKPGAGEAIAVGAA